MSIAQVLRASKVGWWTVVPVCLGAILSAPSCRTHDCGDERLDTARCFGNRVEYCIATDDGNRLGYENCAAKGLVCSDGACVEAAATGGNGGSGTTSTSTAGGSGGEGGAPGGMGGMGNVSVSTVASGSGGAGGSADVEVNGCTQASAVNMTGMSSVTIGADGLQYDPACVRVSVGTSVTMSLNFNIHPTKPGTVINGQATIDMTSELPVTTSGQSAVFTVTKAGPLPYFCDSHFVVGMYGAIFVE